jgi:hypothetical protein
MEITKGSSRYGSWRDGAGSVTICIPLELGDDP